MPSLNSTGSALLGVTNAAISIDGVIPPGLVGINGGATAWLTDTEIVFQNVTAGNKIDTFTIGAGGPVQVDPKGATTISAGAGVYWIFLQGTGVRTSLAGVGPFSTYGYSFTQGDGTTAVVTSYATGSGIAIYSPTGARVATYNAAFVGPLSQDVALNDGIVTWRASQGWFAATATTGVGIPYVQRTDGTSFWAIPVMVGGVPYVVEVSVIAGANQLSIRPLAGGPGYVLLSGGASFNPDVTVLSGTTVRVAVASNALETPNSLLDFDINLATGVGQTGTTATGSLVFTPMTWSPVTFPLGRTNIGSGSASGGSTGVPSGPTTTPGTTVTVPGTGISAPITASPITVPKPTAVQTASSPSTGYAGLPSLPGPPPDLPTLYGKGIHPDVIRALQDLHQQVTVLRAAVTTTSQALASTQTPSTPSSPTVQATVTTTKT